MSLAFCSFEQSSNNNRSETDSRSRKNNLNTKRRENRHVQIKTLLEEFGYNTLAMEIQTRRLDLALGKY